MWGKGEGANLYFGTVKALAFRAGWVAFLFVCLLVQIEWKCRAFFYAWMRACVSFATFLLGVGGR